MSLLYQILSLYNPDFLTSSQVFFFFLKILDKHVRVNLYYKDVPKNLNKS